MDNSFEYKGFKGHFSYHAGDLAFHGIVVDLHDVVHFQGRSMQELRKSFQESVDDYLQWLETEQANSDKA